MELSIRVCIVGGGPIGIELAVALKRRQIDFQLIEAGSIGQTMSWWAPQTRWFSSNQRISIAGVPLVTPDQQKATREQYLAYLRSVVTQFELNLQTYQKVVRVESIKDGGFKVYRRSAASSSSSNDATHCETTRCDALVLAVGGTDFPRRLGIPGEDSPHVDGYLRDPHRYFGRRVMIVGGRNSAAEAALRLHHAGASVSICYRGDKLPSKSIKYWIAPELEGLIEAGRITAYFNTVPQSISPRHVDLRDPSTGSVFTVPADDVLVLIGYEQDKTLFNQCGVPLEGPSQSPVLDPKTMETNVAGIYVAGTAVAGTQSSKFTTFLENCHEHVDKIVAHLCGTPALPRDQSYLAETKSMPES